MSIDQSGVVLDKNHRNVCGPKLNESVYICGIYIWSTQTLRWNTHIRCVVLAGANEEGWGRATNDDVARFAAR